MPLFQPGKSGNPGGRPKAVEGLALAIRAELERDAKENGVNEAVKHAIDIMRTSEDDKCRIAAIKVLLEYGYGRPKESVEHSVDENLESILSGSYEKKPE